MGLVGDIFKDEGLFEGMLGFTMEMKVFFFSRGRTSCCRSRSDRNICSGNYSYGSWIWVEAVEEVRYGGSGIWGIFYCGEDELWSEGRASVLIRIFFFL